MQLAEDLRVLGPHMARVVLAYFVQTDLVHQRAASDSTLCFEKAILEQKREEYSSSCLISLETIYPWKIPRQFTFRRCDTNFWTTSILCDLTEDFCVAGDNEFY